MRHIQGSDRAQSLLLPAAVEDDVGADNPVRAIEAFVDGFDLAEAGFVRAQAKETGRPGYHPGDLLKLYLYGYLNRVRSSRRLEAECHRNLEVTWLLRGLRPDFKTIADFRRENALAFKAAFRHCALLCRKLDLFGLAFVLGLGFYGYVYLIPQYLARLVRFADYRGLRLRLVYYPPYHSKYNPIERCWGALERHGNGTLLSTAETALRWAQTMTWQGLAPVVHLVHLTGKLYQEGVRLIGKAKQALEARLQRSPTLPWYDILIQARPG